MSIYTIRTEGDRLRIIKFDSDYNIEGYYYLKVKGQGYSFDCNCIRHRYPTCRHRKMATIFVLKARIDTGWFYDYEEQRWVRPLVKTVK